MGLKQDSHKNAAEIQNLQIQQLSTGRKGQCALLLFWFYTCFHLSFLSIIYGKEPKGFM